MGCVYKLTSPSKKSYIGATKKTAELRFAKHKEHALGKRESGALYSALRKYGPESFSLEVLITGDDWDKLLALEKELIRLHRTLSPNGYNISEGGQGGSWIATDEVRANCSRAQKERSQRPEQRAQMLSNLQKAREKRSAKWKTIREAKQVERKAYLASEAFKKAHSEATKRGMAMLDVREKLISCAKARAANPAWRAKIAASKTGKKIGPCSEERKQKISAARRKEWSDPIMRAKRLAAFRKSKNP